MSYAGYFDTTASILILGHCSGQQCHACLDFSVAVAAEEYALACLLAHPPERPGVPTADREQLAPRIEVVELQRGGRTVVAAERTTTSRLLDDRLSHATSP